MKDEIKQVLDMMNEGKINTEEAVNLIDALKSTDSDVNRLDNSIISKKKRLIRINVTKDDKPTVNIKVPFSLVQWGVNIANKIGKDNVKIGGEDIPLNLDELSSAINDPELYGKIVDVHDEEKNEHVQIDIV